MSCWWVVIFEEMTERNGNQVGPCNHRVDELESENILLFRHYVCGHVCRYFCVYRDKSLTYPGTGFQMAINHQVCAGSWIQVFLKSSQWLILTTELSFQPL